ncbi:M20/M25/M40 family metallo-hydrolase [Patescibacteria group bacterium]
MKSFESLPPVIGGGNEKLDDLKRFDARTRKVLELSMELCRHETVSVPQKCTDYISIYDCADVVRRFCMENNLRIIELPIDDEHPSPVMIVTFEEEGEVVMKSDLALMGHLDVVPAQDENQFEPKIEGDFLFGRGTADMKTVVASQLVWMAEQQEKECPKPPFITMISFTEENGDRNKNGMLDAINFMRDKLGVVGERTNEVELDSDVNREKFNTICDANRAVHHLKASAGKKLTGIEAMRVFKDVMKTGREIALRNNANISSDRMERQKSWRTSFSNPFLQIAANGEFDIQTGSKLITLERKGKSKHTAEVDVEDQTTAEIFWDIIESARQKFGENVQLYDLEIGKVNSFNTVSADGKMNLIIDSERDEIREWISAVMETNENLEDDSTITVIKDNWDLSLGLDTSLFGLDIREIPEHLEDISELIEDLRKQMQESGGDLAIEIEANGWICPSDNPHLQKIISAYRCFHGKEPVLEGKPHANDGRLVPGGNAIVLGQSGHNPHGPEEAHYIPSIIKWLEMMDVVAKKCI